ncbi:unnamed protein product [Adineta steineri]|uniref:Uncharacterized protein n=1 Tax=Adineta steineri TaxID=433720 RepID=A0A819L213_9BILA|nr:unnamed protein product [Adineta steineri]
MHLESRTELPDHDFVIAEKRGPHKNPRFPKAQQCYSDLFTQNNLDALFVAINAPGHSAYNQVEHCMAPLSHD